jgi:hypothetical protein
MALSFRRNVPAITDDDARTWWTGDLVTALRAAAHLRSLVLASLGQLIPSVNKRPLSCAGMSPSSLAAGPVRVLLIADAVADGWLRIKRSRVRQSAPEGIRSRGQRLSPLAPDPIRCAVLPAVPSHWVPEEIPDRPILAKEAPQTNATNSSAFHDSFQGVIWSGVCGKNLDFSSENSASAG